MRCTAKQWWARLCVLGCHIALLPGVSCCLTACSQPDLGISTTRHRDDADPERREQNPNPEGTAVDEDARAPGAEGTPTSSDVAESTMDASVLPNVPAPSEVEPPDASFTYDAGRSQSNASGPEPEPERLVSSDPSCTPSPEQCNGRDDDCDREIDEVEPIECPSGGFRYCVGGSFSECPQRCEVCVPGSERICFVNYCTFWGVQTCASDGASWGRCREVKTPDECADVASESRNSPDLQRCCMDNDYCCQDAHDLDGDDDELDSVGRCDHVVCAQ